MKTTGKIDYVELPAQNLEASKEFFKATFQWEFTDYGPDYAAFNEGLDGGFYRAELHSEAEKGAALVVLYSDSLEATEAQVVSNGGKIVKPIFSFPGGRRFHFTCPSKNEFAVWSDQ